jgi:hypothetical protein
MRSNNAFERPAGQLGPRLLAASALPPAAQLGRWIALGRGVPMSKEGLQIRDCSGCGAPRELHETIWRFVETSDN